MRVLDGPCWHLNTEVLDTAPVNEGLHWSMLWSVMLPKQSDQAVRTSLLIQGWMPRPRSMWRSRALKQMLVRPPAKKDVCTPPFRRSKLYCTWSLLHCRALQPCRLDWTGL